MAKHNKTVTAALQKVIDTGRVTSDVGKPLVEQGLIEVDTTDVVDDAAKARLTQKGMDGMPKQGNAPVAGAASAPSNFEIFTGAVLPPSKRGAGRVAGPAKYPFADLPLNGFFFVADSATKDGNALKTMGTAISNANNKYRFDTGTTESVVRTKRDGKKAALDAAGKKIKETVTVPVYKYERKFAARAVTAGQVCGGWTASANGALISRTV